MIFTHSLTLFRQGLRPLKGLLNLVLPPRCLACAVLVREPDSFCDTCWQKLHFVGGAICSQCGIPFEDSSHVGMICGACLHEPPAYTQARSLWVYGEASREAILAFKHADRPEYARAFARLMKRVADEMAGEEPSILVPVPLHRWRLWQRGYNQSALLAQHLGKTLGWPVSLDALVRTNRTRSQNGLTRRERRKNVKGAFTVLPGRAALIHKCRVVLIDDVLTTGATVEACSRALLKAGAREVRVLTIARVVATP